MRKKGQLKCFLSNISWKRQPSYCEQVNLYNLSTKKNNKMVPKCTCHFYWNAWFPCFYSLVIIRLCVQLCLICGWDNSAMSVYARSWFLINIPFSFAWFDKPNKIWTCTKSCHLLLKGSKLCKFTLPVLYNSNLSLQPVNKLPRNEKSIVSLFFFLPFLENVS